MSDEKRKSGRPSLGKTPGSRDVGQPTPKRLKGGKWAPGQSANPAGRPKTVVMAELRAEFQPQSAMLLRRLVILAMREKGSVAVAAIKEFLDRMWGKAPQPIVGEEGSPAINVEIPLLVDALKRFARGGAPEPSQAETHAEADRKSSWEAAESDALALPDDDKEES